LVVIVIGMRSILALLKSSINTDITRKSRLGVPDCLKVRVQRCWYTCIAAQERGQAASRRERGRCHRPATTEELLMTCLYENRIMYTQGTDNEVEKKAGRLLNRNEAFVKHATKETQQVTLLGACGDALQSPCSRYREKSGYME
jgi:hypothetical protein